MTDRTSTSVVGLTLPIDLLTLDTPTNGLVLTSEGTFAICGGSTAIAVQLSAPQLAWLAKAAAAFSAEMENDALNANVDNRFNHAAGHA